MHVSRRQVLAGMLASAPGAALAASPVAALAASPVAALAASPVTVRAAAPRAGWAPPSPDRELRVPVRGGRIYVRVNGDLTGPRAPVILIHGGPGSNHGYLTATLPLADERAVILYDQLDSGMSDRPGDPANWTVERFVSELDAIRAALNLGRLHVVGHSWGGTVALEYGGRRPGGLISLTLSSPLISTRSWTASTEAQLATLPKAVQATINRHEREGTTRDPGYAEAMKLFYARFGQRVPRPDWLKTYEESRDLGSNDKLYQAMWGSGEIRSTGTLRDYDGEPLLPLIAAPTLVMCGEYDEFTPAAAAPLARRIPRVTTATVAGASHSGMIDRQDVYVANLRAHFARAERAG